MSRDDMELLFNNVLLVCQLCLGLWQFCKLTPVGALIQGAFGWLLRPMGLSPVYSRLQHCGGRVFKKANCFALEADIPSERRDIVRSEVNTIELHYLGREYVLERKGEDSNMLYIDQKMCYYITHRIWKKLQNLEQVLRHGLEGPPLARAVVTRTDRADAHAERAEAVARSAEPDAERAESMARSAGAEAERMEAELAKAEAEAEHAEAEAERAKAEHGEAEAEAERAEAEAERAKAEHGKAEAEAERAEAERAEAEAEWAEAEAGRAKAEHGKAKAEAERAEAEHGKAEAKRDDAERRKAEDKAKGKLAKAESAKAKAKSKRAKVLHYGLEGPPLARAVVTRAAANRAEARAERAEADARSAEPDAERAESMTRDAGAEAEAERLERLEAEEAEAEQAKAEAEWAEAEAERAKAEHEKAEAEAERAEAEAERAKAEHGKAEAKRADAERRKAEDNANAKAELAKAKAEIAKAKTEAKRANAAKEEAEARAMAMAEAKALTHDEAKAKAKAMAMAVMEAESKGAKWAKAAYAEFAGYIARSAATQADEAMRAAKSYRAAADNASLAARAATNSAADKAALAAAARARIPALRAAAADARAAASAASSAAAELTATATSDTTLFVKGKKEFWKEVITGGVMTFKEVSDAIILYNQHVSRRLSNDWLLPVNLSVSEENLLKLFNLVALFLQTKKANVHWLIPTAFSFISALLEFSTGLRAWFYTKINELFCNIMHFICDPLPRSWRQQVYSMGMWVEDLTPSNDILVKVVRGNMCAIITECLKIDIKGPVLVVKIKPCSDVEWPDNMYTVITPSAKIDREGPILVPWLETDLTPDYGVIEKQFRCYPIDIIIRCSYVIEHELCEISAPTICVFYVKCKSTEDFKHIVTLISCVAENCCGSLIYYGPNNKVRVRGFKESITSYVNNGFPPIYKLELENVVIV